MNKKQITIVVVLSILNVVVIGVFGHAVASTTTHKLVKPTNSTHPVEMQQVGKLEVSIDLSVELTDGGFAMLVGQTNLPDETVIMTSVRQTPTGFSGQDRVSVREGSFSAGPFGESGQGLPIGRYFAEIVVPYPLVQSDSVRAIIGENGEKLAGDLVTHKDAGPIVTSVKEFNVAP